MRTWAITDRGAVRQQNQDSYCVLTPEEGCTIALVCDGMGGAKAGNVASRMAVDAVETVLSQTETETWKADPRALWERCISAANEAILHRALNDPECEGMGTTLVGALILGETVHIVNVGDSRAYFIGEEVGIRRITRDHSLVEDLVRQGKLSPEKARTHPQKNLITRALGAALHTKGDLYEETLVPGCCLLLCSDGLSNVMDDQEISYEVLYGGPEETCCERLLRLAMDRGAPDNVTVVLLKK